VGTAVALSGRGPAIGAGTPAPAARALPDSVVLLIGNRLFPDFREVVSTGLRERRQIGDSDMFFEVLEFYPHFAIVDSTRKVVTLSDEPKNPAFRIKVFENEAAVDSTWAFFNLDIPHFSRTSALWFRVLAFDYRGEVFQKEPPAPEKDPGSDPNKERP
jgi:hypothetical protein